MAFSKFTTNFLRTVASRYVRNCSSQSTGISEILTELEQLKKKKKTEYVRRGLDEYLFELSRPASDILANLTTSDQMRLQKIKEEHDQRLLNGEKYVPKILDDELTVELLRVRSDHSRLSVYKFFYKKRQEKEKAAAKREQKALQVANQIDEEKVDLPPYRLIRRISYTSQMKFYNARLFANSDFSQKLLIDMSYEYVMRVKDMRSLAGQLRDLIGVNRSARDPFKIVFSNMTRNCNMYYQMKKEFAFTRGTNTFQDFDDMPHDRFDNCVLEHADEDARSNFIYLTPNSPYEMKKFDHTKTYIIGGLVDAVVVAPYSYKRALDLNIQHARLPLDRYLKWTMGRKSLTLDVVMRILMTLKQTDDFNEAFKHIPLRHTRENDKISLMLKQFNEGEDFDEPFTHAPSKDKSNDDEVSRMLKRFNFED